ncbi:MAG: hypothetical protein J5944_02175 [Lentisphaeria bacterium]|nr:hypothetical protein [Lentisphaeria bacterium]
MKKWILTGLLMAAGAVMASARQRVNPDENTLWIEDGAGVDLSGGLVSGRWLYRPGDKKSLELRPKSEGGFSLFAPDGNGRSTVTRVKVTPDYPFLVFHITGFEALNGYRNWTVGTEIGSMTTCQVNSPQKGYYVYDLLRNLPEKEAARTSAWLRLWLYNLRMDLEYIKLVKQPDYAVRAECADPVIRPGSNVKFVAELKEEAEDVSIRLMTDGQVMPIRVNGEMKIQLKPVDETCKVWTAELIVKTLDLPKPRSRHKTLMKMDVLGGELEEPVWVGLPYRLEP